MIVTEYNLNNLILLVIITSIYTVVQSMFGVGLLLFGTPTLLLLGYSFKMSLFLLLPISALISLAQIIEGKYIIQVKHDFFCYSIPIMIAGITLVSIYEVKINFNMMIGTILLSVSFLRINNKFEKILFKLFSKKNKLSLFIIGFVHGLTNQGGALLTLYFSTIYKEKTLIRANIAFCYFIFAVSQLIILSLLKLMDVIIIGFILSFICLIIYYSVGNKLFHYTTHGTFNKLITCAIAIFGIILIYKSL